MNTLPANGEDAVVIETRPHAERASDAIVIERSWRVPDAFAAEMDRLWNQVKPLYDSLHCYVRANLSQKYGADVVPPNGPIPAHLLGNIWAQEWGNIYDAVAPAQDRWSLCQGPSRGQSSDLRFLRLRASWASRA